MTKNWVAKAKNNIIIPTTPRIICIGDDGSIQMHLEIVDYILFNDYKVNLHLHLKMNRIGFTNL